MSGKGTFRVQAYPHRYLNIHFHFNCEVSEELYVQIRKHPWDNPPRSLAPHNYFEKLDKENHVYYGLDPVILAPIPSNPGCTAYFKVIDEGGERPHKYAIFHIDYDYSNLKIDTSGSDVTVEKKGRREIHFTINAFNC